MNPRSTFSSVNGIIKALMVEEIVRDNIRDHVDYWDYYNTLAHIHRLATYRYSGIAPMKQVEIYENGYSVV